MDADYRIIFRIGKFFLGRWEDDRKFFIGKLGKYGLKLIVY